MGAIGHCGGGRVKWGEGVTCKCRNDVITDYASDRLILQYVVRRHLIGQFRFKFLLVYCVRIGDM